MLKLTFIGGVLAAVLNGVGALAGNHTWYPGDCVSIDYCGPIEDVAWISPGGGAPSKLAVYSNRRTAVMQRTFYTGKSEDGRMHVCMRYDPFGSLEVTCLLLPEAGF